MGPDELQEITNLAYTYVTNKKTSLGVGMLTTADVVLTSLTGFLTHHSYAMENVVSPETLIGGIGTLFFGALGGLGIAYTRSTYSAYTKAKKELEQLFEKPKFRNLEHKDVTTYAKVHEVLLTKKAFDDTVIIS